MKLLEIKLDKLLIKISHSDVTRTVVRPMDIHLSPTHTFSHKRDVWSACTKDVLQPRCTYEQTQIALPHEASRIPDSAKGIPQSTQTFILIINNTWKFWHTPRSDLQQWGRCFEVRQHGTKGRQQTCTPESVRACVYYHIGHFACYISSVHFFLMKH